MMPGNQERSSLVPSPCCSLVVKSLSCFPLFATPWTVARQAPPSMEFSRQEYWSGLPFPSPGDLPNSGTEPGSPTLQVDALLFEHHWLEGSCFTILCACLLCTRLSHVDAHSPSLLSPPARRPMPPLGPPERHAGLPVCTAAPLGSV